MRAVTQHRIGGPEVLELIETEPPEPLPGEVLIRVRAAGVNPVDCAVRAGIFPILRDLPFTVGWDVSGVVERAGYGAKFAVGDEVYGMPLSPRAACAYAEYVAAPSRQLARKPATLDHVHAAALPLAALTAWQCLAVATEVGADELIDYTEVDYAEAVRDADVVLDSNFEGARSLRTLRRGGVLVSVLDRATPELLAQVEAAGCRFAEVSVEPDYAELQQIAELVDAGQIRPHVSAVFPLERVAEAHELLEARHVQGKVVLTL